MISAIPVSFPFGGKQITGTLSNITGGGAGDHFHLMVANFYWGRLRTAQGQWVFDPSRNEGKELARLADYFGDIVIAWYQ